MSHENASKSQITGQVMKRMMSGEPHLRPRVLICHGDADPFISAENRAAPLS